ncbi:galactose-binding domain-like protein [Aspergillus alliaceus]|uniref:Galactose-binding domain-like protein n=1 Tax=Petromyces alliaceus TaxID=209559 RepID=A0A5N7C7B5_PETAA|nr:galactose-binding domain-like protein [Aspergillus alliaceus]
MAHPISSGDWQDHCSNRITYGGPMEQIAEAFEEARIVVPSRHNEKGMCLEPLPFQKKNLDGRQSKIIVTDYKIGKDYSLTYATLNVDITSDNSNSTWIEVYTGDERETSVRWNGELIYGSLIGSVPGMDDIEISLPSLSSWRALGTLPELTRLMMTLSGRSVTGRRWSIRSLRFPFRCLTQVTMDITREPRFTVDDSTDKMLPEANVTVQYGAAAGWTGWLNGVYVGGLSGAPTMSQLGMCSNYTGHSQNSQKSMGTQKSAGNHEGHTNRRQFYTYVASKEMQVERRTSTQSVRFSTTSFTLDLDEKLDVPIGLELQALANTEAVVQIFMNGYQFGHYLPHIGPQNLYPFPPGVINNRGENSLAISMWTLTDAGARLEQVELKAYAKYRSGINFNQDWSYLQPGWTDRKEYV